MAIEEARKSVDEGDGRTHPKVGAVVVLDDEVLASAHRGEFPGCHAEYIVLERKLADSLVAGATVYTTLEPCTQRNHPKVPCALRLVERKVKRVVIGALYPNPEIRGSGQLILRNANIITDLFPHDLMSQVEEMNREFTRIHQTNTADRDRAKHAEEAAASRDIVHEQRFLEQLRSVPETEILKAKLRWRISIRPTEFMEAQFRDLSACAHFVQLNAVRSPCWDYPCPSTVQDPLGKWIAGELDIPHPRNPHRERWVLFRSGKFVHYRGLPHIPQFPNDIHYLQVLQVVSQAFEFATRMTHAGVLSPEAKIKVELHKVGGRGLLVPGSSGSYYCKEGDISLEEQVTRDGMETRSRDLALDAIVDIYKKFGWMDAERSRLADKINAEFVNLTRYPRVW